MGNSRQTGWRFLTRTAGEEECNANSNNEGNHQAQHKKAIIAKQSQGMLHVDWMMQQGGCPLATGNTRVNKMSHAQTGSILHHVVQ